MLAIFSNTFQFKISLPTSINNVFQFFKENFIKIIDERYGTEDKKMKIRLNTDKISIDFYLYLLDNKKFSDETGKFKKPKTKEKTEFEEKIEKIDAAFDQDIKHNKKQTGIDIKVLPFLYSLKDDILNTYSFSFVDLTEKVKIKFYNKMASTVAFKQINREDFVYFSNYINKVDNEFFLDDYNKPKKIFSKEKNVNDILKENEEFKDYYGEEIEKNYKFNVGKYIGLVKVKEKIFIEKIKNIFNLNGE